jgi:hypothetical protein
MKYIELVGQEIDGILVTGKLLDSAELKACTNKRKTFKKAKDQRWRKSNAELLETEISKEDIIRLFKGINALMQRNEARARGEEVPSKKDLEVKFDDVRNMSLGLDNLEGYTEAEKSFVQQRLCVFEQDFELKTATDRFIAWRAVICEMNIRQLELLKVYRPKEIGEIQKQIDVLDNQYKKHCDALNVLKKQRDNTKEKPKETTNLTDIINKLDKSIEELQMEVDQDKQQEKEMIQKRNTRLRRETKK